MLCKGGHILELDPFGLAIAALGLDMDQSGRRFQTQMRDGLLHRNNAAIEQNGCNTDGIGS